MNFLYNNFQKLLNEAILKISSEKEVKEYCDTVTKIVDNCLNHCPIKNICKKHEEKSNWLELVLNDIKIIQRKQKLEKLLS